MIFKTEIYLGFVNIKKILVSWKYSNYILPCSIFESISVDPHRILSFKAIFSFIYMADHIIILPHLLTQIANSFLSHGNRNSINNSDSGFYHKIILQIWGLIWSVIAQPNFSTFFILFESRFYCNLFCTIYRFNLAITINRLE